MGPLNNWLIPGFLLLVFGISCCKSVHRACTLKNDTNATSMCPMPQNFASRDYKCFLTSEVLCGETTLVGQDSACVLIDDLGVTFFCRYGKWTVTRAGGSASRDRRSVQTKAVVAGVVVGVVQLICSIFCHKEVKQNNPPKFTSCPGDITQYAPSGQTEAVATWTEPMASDPDGGTPSVQRYGPASGRKFPAGSTQITYRASDEMGFTDYFFFTVQVIVERCPYPSDDLHATQSCNNSNFYGSVCSYTCNPGYQLPNSAKWYNVTCGADRKWSHSFPICEYRESRKIECPPNQHIYSGPLQIPVTVTWPDPVTTDNVGDKITFTSNPANGSSLTPGFHYIKITGLDASGNNASCNFLVTIEARKCPPLLVPPFGRPHICTSGYVEGSECTLTCSPGYQVQGDATVQCLRTELWNAWLPKCEAVTCPILPHVAHGSFVCPLGQQYRATCSLLCDTGFRARDATFIQCQTDRTWTESGTCQDVEAPQFPNGCADNIKIYQAKLGSQTLVKWNQPAVTDNSGATVSLTNNIPSNSPFPSGVTWVTYTATDLSKNSASCRFSITVTTLYCATPNIEGDFIVYMCDKGHVYGATCTLTCNYGFPLVGDKSITCQRDDSTYPPIMKWMWPSAVAPVCKKNNCTDLPSPTNGSLRCSLGNFGWICLMYCQSNWDLPTQTDGHFYCTNVNNFWIPSTVPDCIERIIPGRIRFNSSLLYYASTCNMSLDELKVKFVKHMNSSVWRDACITSCQMENVKVGCALWTSERKRRDTDDTPQSPHLLYPRKTSPFYAFIDFQIVMDYDESSSSKEQIYMDIKTMKEKIYNQLNADARSGVLSFDDLTTSDPAFNVLKETLDCPVGMYFRPRVNTTSFSCAGCGAGYYLPYDTASAGKVSRCEPCPVGTYTDLDNATTCTSCPPGWTTTSTSSKKSRDCNDFCQAGSFAFNGLAPCQSCPSGHYQSRGGSVTCDLCPVGTWTNVTGATSRDQCIPVDECLQSPCGIHPCENRAGGFLCHCQSGWTGVTCTTPPDPCNNHECRHGATCVSDGASNYTCACSGEYTGKQCELAIVGGGWGDWSPWTACTVTCGGGGQQHRQRLCNKPAPLNGGLNCTGNVTESFGCGVTYCPVNGNWSAWLQWSSCITICDGGKRIRQRTCNNPVPLYGGRDCQGSRTDEETCNSQLCPVNGGWSAWLNWTQCSVSCGGGTMSRDRTCTNPSPANGGSACFGHSSQNKGCNAEICPECPNLIRPTGSLLVCSTQPTPFLKTCNVTCGPDYISPTAIPHYTCGQETNYIWSHQRDARVSPVLPETCKRLTSVEVATMNMSVSMDANCDIATSVKDGVLQNMASSVKCLQQNACQAEVFTNCDNGNAGQRRRSAGPLVLFINITSIFGPNMMLNPNDTASVQRYADWLRLMEDSAATVIGNATHNVFTVTVSGKVVSRDLKALTYTTALVCPAGSGAYGGCVCVECPHGYKEENGGCVPCPLGQYQDQAGSTSCKPCPDGLTWDVLAAFSVHQCLYPITTTRPSTVTTTVTATVTTTPEVWGDDDADDSKSVIAIASGVCVTVLVLGVVSGIVVTLKYKKIGMPELQRRWNIFFAHRQLPPTPIPDARQGTAFSIGTPPPPYDDTLPMSNTPTDQSASLSTAKASGSGQPSKAANSSDKNAAQSQEAK